tara:strand:- start:199 stop:378 length:180 start_codon:yes stop_codon:yes gene_type:complete
MKKACKTCRIFVTGDACPICKNKQFVENWKGRLAVLDPEKSKIAEKVGIKVKGEYAIKT